MKSQPEAARRFRMLHETGFVMPNAWDAGSAIVLASEGFPAIATTSGGIAFSLGKQDYWVSDSRLSVTRDEMFSRIRQIVEAVDVPVNGDLEAGYGDSPEAVAETIDMAITAGLAGGNIEDKKPRENTLYDEGLAVERIAAAHQTIKARNNPFVLTARTDGFATSGPDALKLVVRRANRFLEAGADCVFAPGAIKLDIIRTLVREIGGPINVVMGLGTAEGNAHVLLDAGVRRISLGASIARSALGFIRQAAREVRDAGTVTYAGAQIPQQELGRLFAEARGRDL